LNTLVWFILLTVAFLVRQKREEFRTNNDWYSGTASEFRTRFENPIRRGRDAGGTDKEVQQAQEKLQELNQLVNRCIIRRTQALLTKYLPVKSRKKKKL